MTYNQATKPDTNIRTSINIINQITIHRIPPDPPGTVVVVAVGEASWLFDPAPILPGNEDAISWVKCYEW